MAGNLYHIRTGNEQRGPFTIGQLRMMWLNGSLKANASYRSQNSANWTPITALADVLEASEPSPTDPAAQPTSQPASPERSRPASPSESALKRCPYCAEEILAEAKKCKHCGEFLDGTAPRATPAPTTASPAPSQQAPKKTSGVAITFGTIVGIGVFWGGFVLFQDAIIQRGNILVLLVCALVGFVAAKLLIGITKL